MDAKKIQLVDYSNNPYEESLSLSHTEINLVTT
jgi:hypothetical protein